MDFFDLAELAGAALKLSNEQTGKAIEDNSIEDLVEDRFGIEFDQFGEVAEALLTLTPIIERGFRKERHNAFMSGQVVLISTPVKEQARG